MSDETDKDDAAEPLEPETRPAVPAMFVKGGAPGPGRPRGALNRTTVVMKHAITTVFADLQARHGGDGPFPHFLAWAESNPTDFYRIASKLIPVQLEAPAKLVGRIVFKGVNG